MATGYSDEVRYYPWVGDHYSKQQQRWLVLGESSYELQLTETHAVTHMIRAHCGDSTSTFETGRYRVCAAAERLITGCEDPAPVHFWQTVAFYNYVRDSMAGAKARPTTLQFRQSLAAFNEVVCRLRPTVVLVLGIRLWDVLPGERDGWTKGPELALSMPTNARKLSLWTGRAQHASESHEFTCFPVAHPSSRRFASSRWKDWMDAAKACIAAQS
ncbi:hypothetical protein [Paraburkholderia sp. DHOC27]|uniref:hypothetical protein n=1 Tax=Paraburkholderia sp. DHOC27 TaxID=2303330 RepID=UPI000E3C523E|nr:hypothetical protein [Paraburkholderia sp. DHOC27]RFU44746.1 hypothetical protein D0B32_27015 [Paraburkholderia sp. DHOC27]